MYCDHCGTLLDEKAAYCAKCGSPAEHGPKNHETSEYLFTNKKVSFLKTFVTDTTQVKIREKEVLLESQKYTRGLGRKKPLAAESFHKDDVLDACVSFFISPIVFVFLAITLTAFLLLDLSQIMGKAFLMLPLLCVMLVHTRMKIRLKNGKKIQFYAKERKKLQELRSQLLSK